MKALKIIGKICLILGGVTLLLGIVVLLATFLIGKGMKSTAKGKDFYKNGTGVETIGTVIQSSLERETKVTYTRFQYHVDSEDMDYVYMVGWESSLLPEGKEVEIYYNPSNPTECVIPAVDKVANSALAISCVLTGIGVGFAAVLYFVAGAVLLSIYKKKSAAAQ